MNSYADLTTLKSTSYLGITATTDDTYLRKLLEDASRVIDRECHRHFYCDEATKYMDGADKRLYFPDDVLSITTLKLDPGSDGTFENSLTANTDYNLYPLNGFPKHYAQLGYNASYSDFCEGIPRAVEIVGIFGYGDGLSATHYISKDAVQDAAGMTAAQTTVTVVAGSNFAVGQTIRIESEQCYITSISSNALTIRRAVNGTTAATHANAKTISVYEYPISIAQACLITAMRVWKRKDSAFVDIMGNPETGQIPVIKGLDPDVKQRLAGYDRLLGKVA